MNFLTKNRPLFTCLLVYLLFCCFFTSINAQQQPTVDQFMGVNWQWSNPIPPTECVGFIREFHDWSNDQNDWEYWEPVSPVTNELTTYPNQCFGFNPPNSGAIDYDFFYTDMLERGLTISPAMTNSLRHYRGYESGQDTIDLTDVGDIFRKPVKWTFDGGGWTSSSTTEATSYIDRSDWIYNFVARYGGNDQVNPLNIKDCAGGVPNLGQGQITYIESWNEPNKDGIFGDPESDFSPQEYATMANLDFDGDDGIQDGNNAKLTGLNPATGANYQLGINTVDPSIRYVMAGTVDIDDIWNDWILPMRTWFLTHRDDGDDFPFDVLNFHHYSTSGPNTFTDFWISPERDEFRVRMADLVNLKNTAFGGAWADKEIWLSEFGYDTNDNVLETNGWDFVGGPGNPTEHFSVETLQAQWTLRTYLELSASGIDRTIVHDLRDGSSMPEANWDRHTGLLNTEDEPKKAWFYVYTMKNLLEGYNYFDDSQSNSTYTSADAVDNSGAYRVYQFKNDADQSVWAVWSPTNSGNETSVTITLSDNHNGATGFRVSEPSIHGVAEELTVTGNNQVTVMATETPIFIVEEERTAPECPDNITANNVTCNTVDLEFDIPEGETYETYQLWFGPTSSISDPNNPDFAALDGNGMNFQQDIPGNQNCLTISGLDAGESYYVYIIPENENGIPVDAEGNIQYCFVTVTTSATESICGIDMNDNTIVNIYFNDATPGFTDVLFDEQDLDFCQSADPIPSSGPWVNFNDKSIMEIEFLQDNYIIDQLYYFDGSSSGIFLVEGSIDGQVWTELTSFYTNKLNEWRSESNFFPFNSGVKFLRLTAESDRARLNELFICGRPVCSSSLPTTISFSCNTVDFVNCEEATFFNSLEIQGNSGIETYNGINSSSFNYPSLLLGEAGPNQLIPGVNYNPTVETCVGGNCTSETLSFTANTTNCILDNAEINPDAPFAGRCGSYTLPVDANVGDQVQLWLSHTLEFNDNTIHPLVRDPNAEMMVLTVENVGTIGNSITFSYDECEKNVYLAYRYFTEDESSLLFNISLVTSSTANNLAWYAICDCTGNTNTPTPTFIIEDCNITEIVYDYLEVGEKLRHREFELPSTGGQQLLHNAIHGITNPNYTYHVNYVTEADRLKLKVSASSPWATLNLANVPCITTNIPPPTGTEKEQISESEIVINNDLKLYPNPTRGYLNVSIAESVDLLLIGVDGKSHDLRDLKKTSFGYQFSTSHIIPGLYLLRTIDEAGKIQTGKFLVQE